MANNQSFSERERNAIKLRLNNLPLPTTADRRRADRIYDLLKLDEIADDNGARILNPASVWAFEHLNVDMSSDERDNLLGWLEPTPQAPLTGFMGRVLGPVWDRLKASRDGDDASKKALAAAAAPALVAADKVA